MQLSSKSFFIADPAPQFYSRRKKQKWNSEISGEYGGCGDQVT
jgi:hypothetical protein